VFGLEPRSRTFAATLGDVRTALGEPLPPRAHGEILRLAGRLALVQQQLAEVEAERDAVLQPRAAPAPEGAPPECPASARGTGPEPAAAIAALARLRGIGANDATLLTHEVFYREFRNRRELASWAGLTPTPWASGDVERDQGIGRDGPGWVRAQLVQMAWRWVRFQPDSALSQWFQARTAGARGRIRRVMIVALARKLLIALWRFANTGLVPTGARVA